MARTGAGGLDYTPSEKEAHDLWIACMSLNGPEDKSACGPEPQPTGYYPRQRCNSCGAVFDAGGNPFPVPYLEVTRRSGAGAKCGAGKNDKDGNLLGIFRVYSYDWKRTCYCDPEHQDGQVICHEAYTDTYTLNSDGSCGSTRNQTVPEGCVPPELSECCGGDAPPGVLTETYESEENTGALIGRVTAALPNWSTLVIRPMYPGMVAEVASSYFNSDTMPTYYAREDGKWRVKHPPSPTCYLKVWIDVTFTPDSGEPVATHQVYEWTGTKSPCVEYDSAGMVKIIGPENYVPPPEANGAVTVSLAKYSFLPDYEPGEGDTNGFPGEKPA